MQLRLECDICTRLSPKLMVTLRYNFLLLTFTFKFCVLLTVRFYVTKKKKELEERVIVYLILQIQNFDKDMGIPLFQVIICGVLPQTVYE